MPLHKKKKMNVRAIAIGAVIVIVIALMIISFPPVRNVTEIVLYP